MAARSIASEERSDTAGTAVRTLATLRKQLNICQRCSLYKNATQAVPGEGALSARVMLVGEQPGNDEDLTGRPFVGPAGRILNGALTAAGMDRTRLFVTNAVKHFKFAPRGKRRLHQRPTGEEVAICRMWNELERAIVKPEVTIALGATAARSLMGKAVTISSLRGDVLETPSGRLIVTIHPSYLLRIQDEDDKRRHYRNFVADLKLALPFYA